MQESPASSRKGPASRRSSIPPRVIHQLVDYAKLPPEDAEFYKNDAALAEKYISIKPSRDSYITRAPCLLIVCTCIDEREQDFELTMGLPYGVANILQTGGNKFGEANLAFSQFIQRKLDKAVEARKRVLLLFVTHESKSDPMHDSCAAWGNRIEDADAFAAEQVERFNQDFVDREPRGSIMRRHLVAVHLKSITDTEAKIWVGSNGKVIDPSEFLPPTIGSTSPDTFKRMVSAAFEGAFPYEDSRFTGMSRTEWRLVLEQMGDMFIRNLESVQNASKDPDRVVKTGHKGTRVLVGRGWDMYCETGKYFKVGDMVNDLHACRLCAKYLIVNGLLSVHRGEREWFPITFHINVPYDMERPADRSGSIRHGMNLARVIDADLRNLLSRKRAREKFDAGVREALQKHGVEWESLSEHVRIRYKKELLKDLRLYVSVATRDTRELELVATGNDL